MSQVSQPVNLSWRVGRFAAKANTPPKIAYPMFVALGEQGGGRR